MKSNEFTQVNRHIFSVIIAWKRGISANNIIGGLKTCLICVT